MKQHDCYQLGEVIKTHGLNGEVSIFLDVDFPDDYKDLESVFLEQGGKLVPFFIETIQISTNKALVKFEDIDTIEAASALAKTNIFLPVSELPELPENGYYFHDLVGCVVEENGSNIGTVDQVIDLSGNELLVVSNGDNEVLIPLKDEILKRVDIQEKKIEVLLPDGLLDLYLS